MTGVTGPTGPPGTAASTSPIGATGPGALATQDARPKLEPHPSLIAEVNKMRFSDLQTFANRLGRVSKFQWDRLWNGAGLLLMGAAVTGIYAYLALTAPTHTQRQEIKVATILALVGAVLCLAA